MSAANAEDNVIANKISSKSLKSSELLNLKNLFPCSDEVWVYGSDGKLITGVSHVGNDADFLGAATGVIKGYKDKYPTAIIKYTISN